MVYLSQKYQESWIAANKGKESRLIVDRIEEWCFVVNFNKVKACLQISLNGFCFLTQVCQVKFFTSQTSRKERTSFKDSI